MPLLCQNFNYDGHLHNSFKFLSRSNGFHKKESNSHDHVKAIMLLSNSHDKKTDSLLKFTCTIPLMKFLKHKNMYKNINQILYAYIKHWTVRPQALHEYAKIDQVKNNL